MYTRKDIEMIVCDTVKTVTGIQIVHHNISLLDRDINIFPADFLYIFDLIENKIGKSIDSILVEYTDDVFIMDNLIDVIYKICVDENI